MVTAKFENADNRVKFLMEQTPFDTIGADGKVIYKSINKNAACSLYLQVEIPRISQSYITSLSGIANHVQPMLDGPLDLTITDNQDFTDTLYPSQNG